MNELSTPLISVLVPIYNVEAYLEECLESLRVQSLKDIEIICINDGSTDGSRKIIADFCERDSRFVCIDKENSGYGDSMNKGLAAARGEYVAILESDDWLESCALEEMYAQSKSLDLDVLKCNFWLHWTHKEPAQMYRNDYYFALATPEMILAGPHKALDMPDVFFEPPSIWSALYRRSFLVDNAITFLPSPGASYQDTSFSFKVYALAKRIAYSGRAYVHYRQDNNASSVNSLGKVYCICDEHAEMKRFIHEEHPELEASLNPIRIRMKMLQYDWNFERLAEEFRSDFLRRYRDELLEEKADGAFSAVFADEGGRRGRVDQDLSYFDELELRVLETVFDLPEYYYAKGLCRNSPSKWFTFATYFRAGGIKFILRALADKKVRLAEQSKQRK